MMRLSPGSSTTWKRPKRSTTTANCCGTMRTPSITNAMTAPRNRIHPENGRNGWTMKAPTASATTTISLPNIEVPPFCANALASAAARSGGALRGDLERIAMGIHDVEHASGLERLGPIDARIPARAAVADAGKPLGRIDPLLEAGRHAGVDGRHLPGAVLRAIEMHAVATHAGHRRRHDNLHGEAQPEPGRPSGAERGDADHQKVERPGEQLCDYQSEPQDRPGQGSIHRR